MNSPATSVPGSRFDGFAFETLAHERRATRHFESTPVPKETIAAALHAASLAPSGYNLQPWRFVVVRDAENRRRLRAAAMDQAKVSEAPVVVVAYASAADWKAQIDAILEENVRRGAMPGGGLDKTKNQAIAFIEKLSFPVWFNRHVMIAFTHLMLAFEAHGWDTAPMEGFEPAKVREVCGLPADAEVVALLAVGRATDPNQPFPGRLPIEKIAFAETAKTPFPGHS